MKFVSLLIVAAAILLMAFWPVALVPTSQHSGLTAVVLLASLAVLTASAHQARRQLIRIKSQKADARAIRGRNFRTRS